MQLENFFNSISFISIKLLPLLGIILLVYLIIMVKNLIVTLKTANKTLEEVNIQIRKLDVPLNTVSEISKSIDSVHELTKESVKSISVNIYQALNTIKEQIQRILKKENNVENVVNEMNQFVNKASNLVNDLKNTPELIEKIDAGVETIKEISKKIANGIEDGVNNILENENVAKTIDTVSDKVVEVLKDEKVQNGLKVTKKGILDVATKAYEGLKNILGDDEDQNN